MKPYLYAFSVSHLNAVVVSNFVNDAPRSGVVISMVVPSWCSEYPFGNKRVCKICIFVLGPREVGLKLFNFILKIIFSRFKLFYGKGRSGNRHIPKM